MKLKLLILLVLLLIGCYPKSDFDDFSFRTGHSLADKQDLLIRNYNVGDEILKQEADTLEKNLWVKTASEIAPSNLVIRQYCLIDLIRETPEHYDEILRQVKLLSDDGQIWLEGYSYWEYTYTFLDTWINKFCTDPSFIELLELVENIKTGFVKTAYFKDSLWYPAPFGDLRNIPLSDDLQEKCLRNKPYTSFEHSIVSITIQDDYTHYTIKGKPVGLNTHIPIDTFYVEVRNGMPNFKFYSGYNDKYKSKAQEAKDIFDRRRIRSIRDL